MGKLVLKKKYQNATLSNGNLREFNTIDITDSNIEFYIQKGFRFIFEEVKKKND
tara:strand:+ start:345 stop:506 length:162 start_codon:yes stop_codon:yes gene_type:complete